MRNFLRICLSRLSNRYNQTFLSETCALRRAFHKLNPIQIRVDTRGWKKFLPLFSLRTSGYFVWIICASCVDSGINLVPFHLIILSRNNIFASPFLALLSHERKYLQTKYYETLKTLLSSSLAERKIINYAVTLFVIFCYQIYLTHRWIPFTEPLQIET